MNGSTSGPSSAAMNGTRWPTTRTLRQSSAIWQTSCASPGGSTRTRCGRRRYLWPGTPERAPDFPLKAHRSPRTASQAARRRWGLRPILNLAVAALVLATGATLAARLWWAFDFLSHFRLQYLAAAVALGVLARRPRLPGRRRLHPGRARPRLGGPGPLARRRARPARRRAAAGRGRQRAERQPDPGAGARLRP